MKVVWEDDIEFITPLFCRGAYRDQPEIRVPSIRGMVRWWFRQLGGTPDEEKQIFGGMKKFGSDNAVRSSSVVFRVLATDVEGVKDFPTLPHKQAGMASPQKAFAPGGIFRLSVFSRFKDSPLGLEKKVKNAIDVWIRLGSLGLRSNRGGGNLWPAGASAPATAAELKKQLLEAGCLWPVYISPVTSQKAEDLRKLATDTVSEPREVFGSARRGRLASPLKIKIVPLEDVFRILITAPAQDILDKAMRALGGKPIKGAQWTKISSSG